MTSLGGGSGSFAPSKLTKTRAKPILKKISHSEKTSLDLDRTWEEQRLPDGAHSYSHIWNGSGWSGRRGSSDYRDGHGSGGVGMIVGSGGAGAGVKNPNGAPRTVRDVTFSLGSTPESSGNPRKYVHHVRSTSGASHHSVATTSSGPRAGSFVHPFQQTPRTSTPPLMSYANSRSSFDNANAPLGPNTNVNSILPNPPSILGQRDYSPTITEDDDDDDAFALGDRHSSLNNYPYPSSTSGAAALHSRSQSNLRRPSLTSHSSLSDITSPAVSHPPPVRGGAKSRFIPGLSSSRSDLNLNLSVTTTPGPKSLPALTLVDSPSSLVSPTSTAALLSSPTYTIDPSAPPVESISSPVGSLATSTVLSLRNSLDIPARFRSATCSSDQAASCSSSKSGMAASGNEMSAADHVDKVRHQRRKFYEKEGKKQEAWDQKMVQKRDKLLAREAAKREAEEAAAWASKKNGLGSGGSSVISKRRLTQSSTTSGTKSSLSLGGSTVMGVSTNGSGGVAGPGSFGTEGSGGGSSSVGAVNFLRKRRPTKSSFPDGVASSRNGSAETKPLPPLEDPGYSVGYPRDRDVEKTVRGVGGTDTTAFPELDPSMLAGTITAAAASTADEGDQLPGLGMNVKKRRRTNTAKARTHGAWTSFILWLRTKLFRLSKSS